MSHPQPVILSAAEENDEWQPHAAEEFQQVGLVGRIATGLLGASTFTHLLCTWSDWNTYGVVNRYLGGLPNAENEDLNRADAISQVTSIPNVIISVAAAVVFVIWLWRARVNSEVFCQADHRRSHGWVLASWFCPGPNLWYPKQIVDDVWVASDPKTPVYADDLRRHRKPMLTSVWWMAWVGALAFDVVIRRFLMWMNPTVGTLRGIALAGTASLILTAVSAIAATLVIRKITAMQTSREWIPWWDQREPKLTAVPTYADDATSEQQAIVETIPAPALRLERQPELQLAGGGGAEDAPPKWSPFAPVAETWQEPVDPGPETQQFSPYESWQEEPVKVEETPSYQQTAASLEPSDWTPQSSPFAPAASTSDDLLPSASTPNWQTESVAPSLSLVQSDPYSPAAYQPVPAKPEQPAAPSWASSYSDTYSYDSSSYDTGSAADYLTSSAPIPAPEPEPAPVARAGRRAARVAVDSPSTIQAAVPETTYYAPEPTVSSPLPDDFLTPSKPLPTVPSFGPEPAATYTTPEPTYSAYEQPYEAPAPQPSYDSYYAPQEPSHQYSEPEPTYNSESYSSSSYETYAPQSTYDSYSDNSYQRSSYPSQEPSYTDQSTYSPAAEYGSAPEYSQSQQSPYAYEQQQPVEPENTSEVTAPRTHPRRRWV